MNRIQYERGVCPVSQPLNKQDFTALYERHVNMVYRLCFTYLKSRADTEDAVQNTFLKVLNSGKRFESPEHERAFLIVTAANTCKDALRRAFRRDEPLEDTLPAPADGRNEVLSAVLSLPEKYRELIYLTYYEGYTSQELETMLNRPASTIRNQLREARERLKIELGGELDAN